MPRKRALQTLIPTTLPVGFTGGVAQGLISTLPYTQIPQSRIQALEETLTKLTSQQMKEQAQQRIALAKERSDILQQNILVKPTTAEKSFDILSKMAGFFVEPISLEEQRMFLEKGYVSPDVVAIPRSAFMAYAQLTGQLIRLPSNQLRDVLSAAKFATSQIDRIIDSVNDMYGGSIILPQTELLKIEGIKDAEEKRKGILNALNTYYPEIFRVFKSTETPIQKKRQPF